MNPNRQCKTCFALHQDVDGLKCRLNPPSTSIVLLPAQNAAGQIVPVPQVMSAWPSVKEDQHCLQWRPRVLS